METLAYLHLVLACNDPDKRTLISPSGKKMLSSRALFGFLSLALMLDLFIGSVNPALALLQLGSRGPEVAELQEQLVRAGYRFGVPTGIYDEVTQAAVMEVQRLNGLAVDGIAGPNTLAVLSRYSESGTASSDSAGTVAGSTLRRESRGPNVTALQNQLKTTGYYTGTITGYYGELTQGAVEAFQRANGLVVDGIAGPNTLAALNRAATSPQPSRPAPQPSSNIPSQTSRPSQNAQSASVPTLREGIRSSDVTVLQNQLKAAGYYTGPTTGYFGSQTETAVRRFQAAQGLAADGIYGPASRLALQNVLQRLQLQRSTSRSSATGSAGSVVNAQPFSRSSGAGSAGSAVNVQSFSPANPSTIVVYSPQPSPAADRSQSFNLPSPPETVVYRQVPTYVTYPRTLRKGDRGATVTELQRRLTGAGYGVPETGIFDDRTQTAVMRFQLARGILPDGVAGPSTLAALGMPGAIRVERGSAADRALRSTRQTERLRSSRFSTPVQSAARLSILELQQRLAGRGFDPGPIDGIEGPRTRAAIARAQQFYGINREDVLRGRFPR